MTLLDFSLVWEAAGQMSVCGGPQSPYSFISPSASITALPPTCMVHLSPSASIWLRITDGLSIFSP